MSPSTAQNRRNHIRYKEAERGTVSLSYYTSPTSEVRFTALIVDESHQGLGCVYVGPEIKEGDTVYWHETKKICTPCLVARSQNIGEDIYLLGLNIVDIK